MQVLKADRIDAPRPPEKVALAIKALYVTLGIGVIRAIVRYARHAGVRSVGLGELITFGVFAVALVLIVKVGQARNWARVGLLVLLIGSIPLAILPLLQSLSHNTIPTVLGLAQVVLYTTAMVFLYHDSSRAWFEAGGR